MKTEENITFIITNKPSLDDENYVIKKLWDHNSKFDNVDIHALLITIKEDSGEIVGGLVARTWWGGLDIQYLWVKEHYRKIGMGRRLMKMAEQEALKRGCHMAYVDTFSFQAVGFYEKMGYREYGKLPGFVHKHTRYYLVKQLVRDHEK